MSGADLRAADVRAAHASDAAAVAEVYRPYVTGSVASFEVEPPDAAAMRERMLAAPRLPWLLAERDGEPVGFAYASRHRARAAYRWTADCSVYLAAPERRRGTGRALYARLLPEVAALGYVRACAGITLPNPGSVGLHEALGFVPVGVYRDVGHKDGRWHDVGWWQRPLRDLPAQPEEPREWSPG